MFSLDCKKLNFIRKMKVVLVEVGEGGKTKSPPSRQFEQLGKITCEVISLVSFCEHEYYFEI